MIKKLWLFLVFREKKTNFAVRFLMERIYIKLPIIVGYSTEYEKEEYI